MPEWKEVVERSLSGSGLKPEREAEVVEESSQHLDDRYEQALRGGAGGEEAYEAALLELKGGELLAEEPRGAERPARRVAEPPGAQGRSRVTADLWQDLRYE